MHRFALFGIHSITAICLCLVHQIALGVSMESPVHIRTSPVPAIKGKPFTMTSTPVTYLEHAKVAYAWANPYRTGKILLRSRVWSLFLSKLSGDPSLSSAIQVTEDAGAWVSIDEQAIGKVLLEFVLLPGSPVVEIDDFDVLVEVKKSPEELKGINYIFEDKIAAIRTTDFLKVRIFTGDYMSEAELVTLYRDVLREASLLTRMRVWRTIRSQLEKRISRDPDIYHYPGVKGVFRDENLQEACAALLVNVTL